MKKKIFPEVTPEFIAVDYPSLLYYYRTRVSPPLDVNEIEKMKYGDFLGFKFLQDNGFTTRRLVILPDDLEKLELRVKDLTTEGLYFLRTSYQKYDKALGRGTIAEKAIKILERDLKKLREGKL